MNKKFANVAFAGVFLMNSLAYTGPFTKVRGDINTSVVVSTTSPSPTPTGLKFQKLINLKEKVEVAKENRAHLKNVKITSLTSSTVTVDNAGVSVTVNVSDKTQLRRRFWGKSVLSEMSVGDNIDVIGKWTDDTKTAINAVLIRDESIQKRFGVFFGTVKSLTSGGFVMTTIHRDDETVTFGSAKVVNRKGETISSTDVKVGDKVRARGLWDSNLKTVTEVTEVKDFSLPPHPSATPTATPTP